MRQLSDSRYCSPNDYVRDLVRRDQDAAAELQQLRYALDAGRASGVSTDSSEDIIAEETARRTAMAKTGWKADAS